MPAFGEINWARSDIQSNAIDVVVIKLLAETLDRHNSNTLVTNACSVFSADNEMIGGNEMNSGSEMIGGNEIIGANALDRLTKANGGWTQTPLSRWQQQFGQMF